MGECRFLSHFILQRGILHDNMHSHLGYPSNLLMQCIIRQSHFFSHPTMFHCNMILLALHSKINKVHNVPQSKFQFHLIFVKILLGLQLKFLFSFIIKDLVFHLLSLLNVKVVHHDRPFEILFVWLVLLVVKSQQQQQVEQQFFLNNSQLFPFSNLVLCR